MADQTGKFERPALDGMFPNYDPHSHLETIHSMLGSLFDWFDTYDQRCLDAKTACYENGNSFDLRSQQADDQYVDAMHARVFATGACSNAAVGALAPLYEGIFNHEFTTLKVVSLPHVTKEEGHRRDRLEHDEYWNPYVYMNRKLKVEEPMLQQGAIQLLDALTILDRFPPNLKDLTDAMFVFRNRALHVGYEWLGHHREAFKKMLLEKKAWLGWFQFSAHGSQPWVFSVTEEFIEEAFRVAVITVNTFEVIRMETIDQLPLGPAPTNANLPDWAIKAWEGRREPLKFLLNPTTYGTIRRQPTPRPRPA